MATSHHAAHRHLFRQVACLVRAARRYAVLLILIPLVALLAACSTRFFYDQVDTWIVWQVDSYVSLEQAQKAELKRRIGAHLNIVALDEMPRAASLLNSIAGDVASGAVTPQMVDARFQEMLVETETVTLGIVPIAEWLLLSLSDKQVQELAESLEDLNEEMYEEYSGSTAEERRKRRNKSSIRAIQGFTGRLSDSQKALVTGALERMTDSSEQWITYQRQWKHRFVELVANPPGPDTFRQELTLLLVYPRSLHSSEYRAAVEANRAIFNMMLAELLNGLSERQRDRMVTKIKDYASTLTGLAQDIEAQAAAP